jgi:nitrite reductase/ring-hydroxylating ferredoxin subunit
MIAHQANLVEDAICAVADLPDGMSRGFDPLHEGRDTMFIVRQGDRLYAYRNKCPHYDQARMAWRKDEFLTHDRTRIMCSAHGALFDIPSGSCEVGPCMGRALEPVPLAICDGQVYLAAAYRPGMPARVGNGARP